MYAPIKRLGQNFLTDYKVVANMVRLLDPQDGDVVIEIGAGLGILTEELAKQYLSLDYKVYALEIDERFILKLDNMFVHNPNVVPVHADVLNWLVDFVPEKDFKILGSLPFYITSPIIHNIIKMKKQPDVCVLLVQKEVAKKITTKAPKNSYLSVFIQTFFDVKYVSEVSKKKFRPSPKVDGAIIKMINKGEPHSLDYINEYEKFLHKGFRFPRKMINKVFTKEELGSFGLSAKVRPGEIPADTWLKLFKLSKEKK